MSNSLVTFHMHVPRHILTIYDECGLRYAAIHRNPEALALFRANSTHLVAGKKRNKQRPRAGGEVTSAPRDPLLSYKKPQLVAHLRLAQQQLLEAQKQQAVLVDARLKKAYNSRNIALAPTRPMAKAKTTHLVCWRCTGVDTCR